jgi:hypothetical protein
MGRCTPGIATRALTLEGVAVVESPGRSHDLLDGRQRQRRVAGDLSGELVRDLRTGELPKALDLPPFGISEQFLLGVEVAERLAELEVGISPQTQQVAAELIERLGIRERVQHGAA